MKAATAPTPPSPARSAAISAPASKSSGRIETRALISSACDRREKADLVALGQRHRFGAEHTVPGTAQYTMPAERFGVAATTCGEHVAQRTDVGRRAKIDVSAAPSASRTDAK